MTTKYYLRIEGVNLSNFVYDTQDLSTVRGGGLLILNSVEMAQKNVKSVQLNGISTGASTGLFEFESDEEGAEDNVKQEVIDYLNKDPRLKHATFVVDVQPFTNDFIEDKEILVARNRWQQMQAPSVAVPSQSTDKDKVACWIDGIRPAKEAAYDPDTPTEKKYISTSVHIRRDYGREQKKELYYKYSATAKQERWKFVNDFDKLTQDTNKGNLNHKMAVIYLDGNGFGKIRDKLCKAVDDEREFDKQIKDYRKKMFADLLDTMKDDEDWRNADKYRFETLLWGGDELLWVVPAWKGWETLLFFYTQSADWIFKNTKREELPLTHAGGMVFCHHNAPIYRIKNLARKLSDSAKAKDKSKNLFAYQVLESFDHVSHNFDDIRARWSTDGNPESLILDGNDMKNIQESINDLKENEFPKNKLHKIIKLLKSGKNADDVIEKAIKGSSADAKNNLIKLKETCNGDNSKWRHITDLWDYIV